jgi:hypothetical protein
VASAGTAGLVDVADRGAMEARLDGLTEEQARRR